MCFLLSFFFFLHSIAETIGIEARVEVLVWWKSILYLRTRGTLYIPRCRFFSLVHPPWRLHSLILHLVHTTKEARAYRIFISAVTRGTLSPACPPPPSPPKWRRGAGRIRVTLWIRERRIRLERTDVSGNRRLLFPERAAHDWQTIDTNNSMEYKPFICSVYSVKTVILHYKGELLHHNVQLRGDISRAARGQSQLALLRHRTSKFPLRGLPLHYNEILQCLAFQLDQRPRSLRFVLWKRKVILPPILRPILRAYFVRCILVYLVIYIFLSCVHQLSQFFR